MNRPASYRRRRVARITDFSFSRSLLPIEPETSFLSRLRTTRRVPQVRRWNLGLGVVVRVARTVFKIGRRRSQRKVSIASRSRINRSADDPDRSSAAKRPAWGTAIGKQPPQDPGSHSEPGAPSVSLYFYETWPSDILSSILMSTMRSSRATRPVDRRGTEGEGPKGGTEGDGRDVPPNNSSPDRLTKPRISRQPPQFTPRRRLERYTLDKS